MATILSPSYTHRRYSWTTWKSVYAAKGGQLQYDDDNGIYLVWFYDGPEIHLCSMWKGDVPEGVLPEYSQAQNDADKADFETNFKTSGNVCIEPRAADGRITICSTTAKRTKNFKLRSVWFYSSRAGSARSGNPITDAEYGDVSLSLWKKVNNAWVTATDADATKTVIDWDPTYAYEIIGGWIDLPTALRDGVTDEWFIACVGVPDYAAYGLAVDFVSDVNLEAVMSQTIVSDGRATQYLSPTIVYGTNYHTNRIRCIIKHPAGAQMRFQWFANTFTA